MAPIRINEATAADYARLLALNEAAVPHVNSISEQTLTRLHEQSLGCRVARREGLALGFLLALPATARYESLNFRFFQARYSDFTYIDRIVVAADQRGGGIGRALYQDLIEHVPPDILRLTCEVNLRPPNPDSLRFHRLLGFEQVAEQDTEGGSKRVALLVRALGSDSA
ncbi:MAG: GNAT family N-acetyltransferase [Pseudomonadales bacterium]